MTFDEKGRAWITESLEYPRRDAGKGRDRVKILEDTDGDGKADKFTVFAEGLNIPSGIAVGHGGVWVANSPDILFYPDADRDGKADGPPEVVVTGFGRDDTHELPNSLTSRRPGRAAPRMEWRCSINHSQADHRGESHLNSRLRRSSDSYEELRHPFQVWCEGTSNPWGIAFNENGDAFASACVIDRLLAPDRIRLLPPPGRPLSAVPHGRWSRSSISAPERPRIAACTSSIAAYPEMPKKEFYMGNIHGNCINVDTVVRSGATYKAKTQDDFLNANDAWFMPVVQKTGFRMSSQPDVLDWYDRYHCYQDANRDPAGIDRLKGRLYRVRYKDTPRRANFDLAKSSDDDLISLLGSANVYDREIAQRLLSERGKPVQEKLVAVASDASEPRKQRMHAMAGRLVGSWGRSTWSRIAGCSPIPSRTIRAFAVRAPPGTWGGSTRRSSVAR